MLRVLKGQLKHPSPTCNDPTVALLLYKFIDAFYGIPSLNEDPEVDYRYYKTYRLKVLKAFKVLEEVLKSYAEDLKDIETYYYANANINTS